MISHLEELVNTPGPADFLQTSWPSMYFSAHFEARINRQLASVQRVQASCFYSEQNLHPSSLTLCFSDIVAKS